MKKYFFLFVFFLTLILSAKTVYGVNTSSTNLLPTVNARIQQEKENLKEEMKNTIQEKKGELLDKIKTEREKIKNEIKTQREEYEEKLDQIKDERKKLLLTQIDDKISKLNLNHTDILTNALEKLNDITVRLEEKINIASGSGQDTTEAGNLLNLVKDAIKKAEDAIAKQAAMQYIPNLGDDQNAFGSIISETVMEHRNDLTDAREIVRNAKKAVIDLSQSVARLNVQINPKLTPVETTVPAGPTANITDIP